MSEDDDFPHLKDERRAYRRNVGFTIAGVLIAGTMLVVRFGMRADRERDARGYAALDHAFPEPPQVDFPSPASTKPDRPAIDLEVVVGGRHVDVDGSPVALGDGRTLELVPRPTRTHVGAELSFRHAASIHVVEQDTVLMTTPESSAELAVMESDNTDAEDLAELASTYTGTGQVKSNEPTHHKLLGRDVAGVRLLAAGLIIELMTAPAGKHRRLRVIVTGTSATADLQPVLDAIETVTTKPLTPEPELDLVLHDASGGELARAPATIGTPVTIGKPDPVEVAINRRETVKEQLSGMSFEHPAELSAIPLALAVPAIQLRSGEIGIQLMTPPMEMSMDDLATAMFSGQVVTKHDVTRTFAGASYPGLSGEMQLGTLALHIEVFPFKRDGRDFVATLQFPAEAEATALRLAGPVIGSVR